MQREHISIPKLIAYVLFSVIIFALQTGTFGGMRIFGSAVDLLPALVTAAALLGGEAENAAPDGLHAFLELYGRLSEADRAELRAYMRKLLENGDCASGTGGTDGASPASRA